VNTTATPASLLDAPGGDLVLRVCGSSRHGQIVRLKSTKCTIGSGPRSTLRLRARGVRPMHCLIVRGSSNTVIRRWSPDTRLNGRVFADAELSGGDRLAIGTIELEVLDPGRLSPSNPAETRQAAPECPPILEKGSPCQLDPQGVDRLTARLALANRQGRQRVRRVLERLRSANREVERLRELQAERSDFERQLGEQTQALDEGWRDLECRREAFERERDQWNANLAEAREETGQQGERPHADQARCEPPREDLEPCRRHRADDHAAVALPPQKGELSVDSEASRQPEPQAAAGNKPIDTAEVFRRMSVGGSSSDGERPSAGMRPQPSDSPPVDQPSDPPRRGNEGEEESIENYMARLLDRLYGDRGGPQQQARGPCEVHQEPPVDPAPQDFPGPSPAEWSAAPQSVARPRQPKEMAPRTVAPERHVDLSAMRELANLSAHSAIDRHTRRQVTVATWGKVLTTTVAVGVSAVLLRIWWTNQVSELTFHAALVSLLVALLWGLQWARLASRKMLHTSRRADEESGEDRDDAELNAAQKHEAPEREAVSSDESNPLIEDSDRAWEHELKSLIDAWPRR